MCLKFALPLVLLFVGPITSYAANICNEVPVGKTLYIDNTRGQYGGLPVVMKWSKATLNEVGNCVVQDTFFGKIIADGKRRALTTVGIPQGKYYQANVNWDRLEITISNDTQSLAKFYIAFYTDGAVISSAGISPYRGGYSFFDVK